MGCGTAVIYIFASKSPFIGIKKMGLTPEEFGIYNLIPIIGMLLGSLLGARLAGRFHFLHLLQYGTIATILCTLSMLIPFSMGLLTPWSLFLPMVLIYLAESIVYANISSFGLSKAKNKSNASAVLNFINLGVAVVAVLLSGLIFPESILLMPIIFIFFFLVMLLLCFRLKSYL
jgi:DHA1 family bicyclomycin/chloramphenicol resistance-like MFS transporter